MDLYEQQEAAAKHHVRWNKAFYAAVGVGFIFLILSRAIPWWSAGFPEMAMGRSLHLHEAWIPGLLINGLLHMGLAVVYGLVLAVCIYRFSLVAALGAGVLVGLALYGLNFLVFQFFFTPSTTSEISAATVHVVFALFFTAVYKGISVPKIARPPQGT
jgi:hypothetical protein